MSTPLIVFAFGYMVANGGAIVVEYPTMELCRKHRTEWATTAPTMYGSTSECSKRESSPVLRVPADPDSVGWADKIAEERRWAKLHPDWSGAAKYNDQH